MTDAQPNCRRTLASSIVRILDFAVVYLLPTVPAVITFFLLAPRSQQIKVGGTIGSLRLRASGGVAAYITFMFIAFVGFKQFAGPAMVNARVILEISGDNSAVTTVSQSTDSISLTLRQLSGLEQIRFERFAAQNGGTTLQSSQPIAQDWLRSNYKVSVSPQAEGIRYLFNPDNFGVDHDVIALEEQTTIRLKVLVRSADPLDEDRQIYHAGDWVNAIWLAKAHYYTELASQSRSDAFEYTSLQVFVNETNSTLAEVVLPYFQLNDSSAHAQYIEGVARKLSSDEYKSLRLDLTKAKDLFSQDGSEINAAYERLFKSFGSGGYPIGRVVLAKGSNPDLSQEQDLHLPVGESTFRIGPLSQGVAPGEVIVLLVNRRFKPYWEKIDTETLYWCGGRMMYPTRLNMLLVQLDSPGLRFKRDSFRPKFTLQNGTTNDRFDGFSFKISPNYLVTKMTAVERGVKGQFYWSFEPK